MSSIQDNSSKLDCDQTTADYKNQRISDYSTKSSNSFFPGKGSKRTSLSSSPLIPSQSSSNINKNEGCCAKLKHTLSVFRFSLKYIFAELIREPKAYVLGWFTVFLMVFFVVLLANAVLRSPLIFMRLAEVQAGEMDMLYTPGLGIAETPIVQPKDGVIPFINASHFDVGAFHPTVKPFLDGAAHRWMLLGSITREKNSNNLSNADSYDSIYYQRFLDKDRLLQGVNPVVSSAIGLLPVQDIFSFATSDYKSSLTKDLDNYLAIQQIKHQNDKTASSSFTSGDINNNNNNNNDDVNSSNKLRFSLDTTSSIILGMDSEREKLVGVGRKWSHPPVPHDSAYISQNILNTLGFPGDASEAIGTILTMEVSTLSLALRSSGGMSTSTYGPDGLLAMDDVTTFLQLFPVFPPGTDYAKLYAEPFSKGGEDMTEDADLFKLFNPQTMINILIAAIERIPIIGPDIIAKTDAIEMEITLDYLSQLASEVFPSPYILTTANGFDHLITKPFPSPLPISDVPFFIYVDKVLDPADSDAKPTWVVDRTRTNESYNIVVRDSKPSKATIGDMLQFYITSTVVSTDVRKSLTVLESIDTYDGKFAESIGQLVIVEKSWMLDSLKNSLANGVSETSYLHPQKTKTQIDVAPLVNNMHLVYDGKPVIIPQTFVTLDLTTMMIPLNLVNVLVASGRMSFEDATKLIQDTAKGIRELPLEDYSPYTIAQFHDRGTVYSQTKNGLKDKIMEASNALMSILGEYFPATAMTPIEDALSSLEMMRIFLDNIFYAVIVLISGLGAMLVYSLLLNDAESKTYEYGMLRALGMRKGQLFFILFAKSAFFSISGIVTGLLAAYLLGFVIIRLITDYAAVKRDYSLHPVALVIGIVIGIVMPIVANITPISRALSKTLRDSLDVYHHVVSDITVKMKRLSDLGLELWVTCVAVFLVVAGFVTFYFIPYAFVFNNYALFLGLLMLILLCMMLGLCMLAEIIQPYLEKFWLYILTSPIHGNLYPVCIKNLGAHKSRNSKTARMFTISLAFIIFAGAMFALQKLSIANNIRQFMGASIIVKNNFSTSTEANIREYLDAQIKLANLGNNDSIVEAYTFVSRDLSRMPHVKHVRFSNLAGYPGYKQKLFAIEENYYEAIYQDLYHDISKNTKNIAVKGIFEEANQRVIPVDKEGHDDIPVLVTGLHDAALSNALGTQIQDESKKVADVHKLEYNRYIDVIVSFGLQEELSVDFNKPARINVELHSSKSGIVTTSHIAKIRAYTKHAPGFTFSSYGLLAKAQGTILMTEASFLKILRTSYKHSNTDSDDDEDDDDKDEDQDEDDDNSILDDNIDEYSSLSDLQAIQRAPKSRLLIKTRADSTKEQRGMVMSGISVYLSTSYSGQMTGSMVDTDSSVESIQFAMDLLNIFFTVVGTISMILCFIILWLSFTSNVQENAWEFGVLRAIGINSKQVIMIYIYEALAIILSCILTGTTIGLLIAISLTLQFNLFTEAAFVMTFPTTLFLVQVGLAIFVAIIASALPAYKFVKQGISDVLRRT